MINLNKTLVSESEVPCGFPLDPLPSLSSTSLSPFLPMTQQSTQAPPTSYAFKFYRLHSVAALVISFGVVTDFHTGSNCDTFKMVFLARNGGAHL